MARTRLLLLLKPFDMYPVAQLKSHSLVTNSKLRCWVRPLTPNHFVLIVAYVRGISIHLRFI
ncbi:hypothetical protein LINPERHAP2_LOCUS12624, partial [Linum perenne]